MQISLSLIEFRDILTNYVSSASLNAARQFEARQLYSGPDADIPSRVLPASIGQEISALDPHEQVFHVQIKKLPADFSSEDKLYHKWSAPTYSVVHPIADWKTSTEARLQTTLARQQADLFNASILLEHARRERMIKTIRDRIPIPVATIRAVFELCVSETALVEMVQQWEKALHITIYELPAPSPQGNQSLPEDAQGADQGTGQAPVDGIETREGCRGLDGEAHRGALGGDAYPESSLKHAGSDAEQADVPNPATQPQPNGGDDGREPVQSGEAAELERPAHGGGAQ